MMLAVSPARVDPSGQSLEQQLLGLLTPAIFCNDAVLRLGGGDVGQGESPDSQDSEEKQMAVTDEAQRRSADDIELGAESSDYELIGDTTETCLLKIAVQLSRSSRELREVRRRHRRLQEIPFDSSTKYMATLHLLPADLLASMQTGSHQYAGSHRYAIMMKGAPERVVQFTKQVNVEMWLGKSAALAEQGMRVLALATKVLSAAYSPETRSLLDEIHHHAGEFSLVCLVGIMDPPRPEAIEAVRCAQEAGITVKMITGDHPGTAKAIGRMLGLRLSDRVVVGRDLDQNISDLDRIVREYDIFARTTPEHKLRIVQSLQGQDNICCMTGDGVNDAPALKAANMGVAMGIAGTEVAKDAAAMIITDDNFATIVQAIKVGRSTYSNLVKTLAFVLPTNGGQAMCVIIALLVGLPVPITALQILWINMVTSISLGLVFAFEPIQVSLMQRPPRRIDKGIFTRFLSWRVIFVSGLLVIAVLGNFQWERQRSTDIRFLRTAAVTTLFVGQIGYLFSCRDLRQNSSIGGYFLGNSVIYLGILCGTVLQVIFVYALPFQYVFQTRPIDGVAWGKVLMCGLIIFLLVEFEKWLGNNFRKLRGCLPDRSGETLPPAGTPAPP